MKKILAIGILCLMIIPSLSVANLDVLKVNDSKVCKSISENSLSIDQVKVASLYEKVTDYHIGDRNIDDISRLLNETKTDFIFRGFWRWSPCPESPSTILPPEYPSEYVLEATKQGYTYQQLEDAINKIKKDNPETIFVGSLPAQRVTRLVWNPMTNEYLSTEDTWAMALNPEKWGIDYSKERFQCEIAISRFWINPSDCKNYDHKQVDCYAPDITNEIFQELFLSWAKKQIDCGADAIWIDLLFTQAGMLKTITNDPNHPAVKESFESASKMVDEIHDYGYSKGKYIYVGTWSTSTIYPYPQPNFDFVTVLPSSAEVYFKKFNENKWNNKVEQIRDKLGDISIFAFIDWGGSSNSPLGVFSQKLIPDDQIEFLEIADEFFQKKGINFIYPIHGGGMGVNAKILSFGKFKVYDSLAPEFQTYETIKELAENKSKGNPITCIEKPRNHFYIFNREIIPLKNTIIIGMITIEVNVYSEKGIDRVEFYVDDVLKSTDMQAPFEWLWNEKAIGRDEMKVIAYDNEGNTATDEIEVIIVNFGG